MAKLISNDKETRYGNDLGNEFYLYLFGFVGLNFFKRGFITRAVNT